MFRLCFEICISGGWVIFKKKKKKKKKIFLKEKNFLSFKFSFRKLIVWSLLVLS